jgi:hypothetical protein
MTYSILHKTMQSTQNDKPLKFDGYKALNVKPLRLILVIALIQSLDLGSTLALTTPCDIGLSVKGIL